MIRWPRVSVRGFADRGFARYMTSRRAQLEERERAYLAFLCQGSLNEALRLELEASLSRHSWQSHDHRAVFDALAGWRAEPDAIRSSLPARLTRLGFPDTDIDEYFAPAGVSIETALQWLRGELAGEPAGSSGGAPADGDSRARG
jgi:hypothetical protein